jgi:amidophosphoribosyltransferase
MSGGDINPTEMVASLINQKASIVEGILYAQEVIKGSMTMLIMTPEGIYASRDKWGRTPAILGRKLTGSGYCICFESFSFLNLGYMFEKELGPGEVDFITPEGYEVIVPPRKDMRICTFLWIYYGFPASSYEGVNVEDMRYGCGTKLAERDLKRGNIHPDCVAGVPDSGVAHAIGYANKSGVPYSRPFVKYTPTWPRSFMPTQQSRRDLIAKMKLIPNRAQLEGKKVAFCDDSIVRGTQLRDNVKMLYDYGAKEVHVRISCPPLLFGCPFLNFSASKNVMELITRRCIEEMEGDDNRNIEKYCDPTSPEYANLIEMLRKHVGVDSLKFNTLDSVVNAIGLPKCELCTHCFDGSSYGHE